LQHDIGIKMLLIGCFKDMIVCW